MLWLLSWKMGVAIAAAVVCIYYAVESANTAREAYQIWQTTRAVSSEKMDR
jgi:hypothetical protein